MATLLQSQKLSATGVTSLPMPIANTTAGSLLIAFVASPTAGRTCSGSDNVNGAYNADAGGASSCNICSFLNNAGGPLTFTGSISGGATSIAIIWEEWSISLTASPLDGHSATGFTAQTTNNPPATTATLVQPSELVVAMCRTATSPGTGYIAQSPFTPDPIGTSSPGGVACLIAAYQIVNSTAAVACTFGNPWQNSVNGGSTIASYKIAAPVVVSQPGGSGKPTDEPEPDRRPKKPARRAKVILAKDVFREEMQALEQQLTGATETAESIEGKLLEVAAGEGDKVDVREFVSAAERALSAAQRLDRSRLGEVPVYIRIPKKSLGVMRADAIDRLRLLARIARYREQLAAEKLRKIRAKMDEDAAVAFMQAMMRSDW